MPAQQKALFVSAPNGDWEVRPREIPKPGPGQVLVKLHAAALNPVDWKIPLYNFIVEKYPAILGTDGAGTVEQLGEGVTRVTKGDRVLLQGFFANENATYQQYTLISADIVAKLPSNMSFDEAASIPVCLVTAAVGLYSQREGGPKRFIAPWEEGGKGRYKGKPVAIFGGSSSVGQYAIQWARLSGFSPIITTASPHNAEYLRSLGATHVVDRSSDVVSEVNRITSAPIEIIVDAISEKSTQEQAWEVLSSGGALMTTLPLEVDTSKYKDKHAQTYFANMNVIEPRSFATSLCEALPKLLEDGSIKPNRVEIVPNGLAGITEGLKRLQENKVSGKKLVVRPQETP